MLGRLYWTLAAVLFASFVAWAFTSGRPYIEAPRLHHALSWVAGVAGAATLVVDVFIRVRRHRAAKPPLGAP